MRKVSNPVSKAATIVLLALAAGTAVRLRSWRGAVDVTLPSDWEYTSSESRRKLEHVALPGRHNSDSYYDQMWRSLKSAGYVPGTEVFESIIRNRVSKQEFLLINELAQYHDSWSALDRAWRRLVRDDKKPGTGQFDRLAVVKGARIEGQRDNEIISRLENRVLSAKKRLDTAQQNYDDVREKLTEEDRRVLDEIDWTE